MLPTRQVRTLFLIQSITRRFHRSRVSNQHVGRVVAPTDASWDWLKDRTNPRVQRFLNFERNYLMTQLAAPKFQTLERTFRLELRNRLRREDASVPERMGAFEYYTRQTRGQNFPVYYRASATSSEQVVLDQNKEPLLNQAFHIVAGMKLSPDATQVLLIMENDHEAARVFLRDLNSGTLTPFEDIIGLKNAEWSTTRAGMFYYTKVDAHARPVAVVRYTIATRTQEEIYHEQDDAFFVDVAQTKDAQFVLIHSHSKNTSETYAIESDAQPRRLRPRERGTLYFTDHAAGRFFFVTNAEDARNFKIATSTWDAEREATREWRTLVPEQVDVKIEDVDLFQQYLVMYERVHSVPRIRVCTLGADDDDDKDASFHYVPLPKAYEIGRITPGVNRQYTAHHVRFHVSTPLIPDIVFEYDMRHRKLQVLKENHVSDRSRKMKREKKSFDPHDFVCERHYVPSGSSLGVKIPLTLIHRRDLTFDGQNPTLLIGYGAYGSNLEAEFELEHLSLLERGWVIALAHVRGGGELGLQWYQGGKKMHKRQTFDDFVACTYHLFDRGVTSPHRLAGKGVSAGGLIMGYVANEYPQLYQALVMKVPFVDIFETMHDPTLPLTIHEYDEWGDPHDQDTRAYIRSYAPCENVRTHQVYPAMFVTGSLVDQRVQFWEPAKWVYQMRQVQASLPKQAKRLLLLKMSASDGHFGAGGRLEQVDESALELAFLYQALDLPLSPK
ncbi:hypothetical protein PsorP6_011464 [Peronosclerospora sorghi]|uniref:Uncharacterized protein n=1 Tax=Peronosclerospora sorghi TaxID=230839 RepID=A0ACC0WI52_9STRA|nr:hypothetical protein PsorP6_011464 [Peronosclerospora sorghi]